MNFLPKGVIENDIGYEKSTEDILRTIDFVEKAQKRQEERAREKLKAKKKNEETKKSFWDDLLDNFKCGHCGEETPA